MAKQTKKYDSNYGTATEERIKEDVFTKAVEEVKEEVVAEIKEELTNKETEAPKAEEAKSETTSFTEKGAVIETKDVVFGTDGVTHHDNRVKAQVYCEKNGFDRWEEISCTTSRQTFRMFKLSK